jgi:TRAP-type mannitol/chloroaromatic compound transport system permease small subunit
MQILEKFVDVIDGISDKIGHMVGWVTTLMVLVVFYDTVMRYAFNQGNVALQELEWHLFSIIFLIGAAYTLKEGGDMSGLISFSLTCLKRQKHGLTLSVFSSFLFPFA